MEDGATSQAANAAHRCAPCKSPGSGSPVPSEPGSGDLHGNSREHEPGGTFAAAITCPYDCQPNVDDQWCLLAEICAKGEFVAPCIKGCLSPQCGKEHGHCCTPVTLFAGASGSTDRYSGSRLYLTPCRRETLQQQWRQVFGPMPTAEELISLKACRHLGSVLDSRHSLARCTTCRRATAGKQTLQKQPAGKKESPTDRLCGMCERSRSTLEKKRKTFCCVGSPKGAFQPIGDQWACKTHFKAMKRQDERSPDSAKETRSAVAAAELAAVIGTAVVKSLDANAVKGTLAAVRCVLAEHAEAEEDAVLHRHTERRDKNRRITKLKAEKSALVADNIALEAVNHKLKVDTENMRSSLQMLDTCLDMASESLTQHLAAAETARPEVMATADELLAADEQLVAAKVGNQYTDQVRLWVYELVAAGVSTRKCGTLLQNILAGCGTRLTSVPSASTISRTFMPEMAALDAGQVGRELLNNEPGSGCMLMDEASKFGASRLAVSHVLPEDGLAGGKLQTKIVGVMVL